MPPGERRFACKWQPTEHFSAHFYPTACPLHDMIAFMHNATHLVHWPHTERVWRTGPDGHARKPGSFWASRRSAKTVSSFQALRRVWPSERRLSELSTACCIVVYVRVQELQGQVAVDLAAVGVVFE